MDRLEKALEKSRQQRAAAAPLVSTHNTLRSSGHAPSFDHGEIDESQMQRNRILAHHTRSHEADIYRQLRTQVLHIMRKNNYRTLAITSPQYGDGKTTIALNLAISMALDVKQTVLIVDLDLRKPDLENYLGTQQQLGLTDYLLKDAPLSDCFMRTPFERVAILSAGSSLDNSSELLGLPRMIALSAELKNRYPDRVVIYDMPPVLAQDDSIAFLPQVEAVLVVVRDGVTRAEDLKTCLSMLSGTNIIGTVLNNSY